MKKTAKRRASAKNLRAIQTSRHLHVAHRRHTGHAIAKRHTSYPVLAMLVLCVGVFLASWTSFASGDPPPITNSYTVHASVPGPAPTIAATIDSPLDGAKITDLPVSVSGSCPLNTYVSLYDNGAFSGVALCAADGTYQLAGGLFIGSNKLQARVYSLTDLPGPISNAVTVTYQPKTGGVTNPSPSSNSTNASSASSESALTPPLSLKTTFSYKGVYTGQSNTWEVAIDGGQAPYAISIDWGDGKSDLISHSKAGVLSLEHTYKKAGGYRGSYIIKLSATDASGTKTYLQLLTIVNDPPAGAANHVTPTGGSQGFSSSYTGQIMKYIWPGYGIVSLMLASFWLGERREIQLFKRHRHRTRHA
jgi:hypothetical protein